MKHSKSRRIVSALLAAVVVLAALPVVGFAGGDALPEEYATVRIEANGFGTDEERDNIETVLGYTVVDLSKLMDDGSGYKAIDVVNKALTDNGLLEATEHPEWKGFYTAFGGVSGQAGESWGLMLNNESAAKGLNTQTIQHGDETVLMLTEYDTSLNRVTTGYAYFRVVNAIGDPWGSAYGEITLALKNTQQVDSENWESEKSAEVDIYLHNYFYGYTSQAYTPADSPATTDSDNGMSTITLWGGADAGIYTFDITAKVDGSTSAFCRATMIYDGTNPPQLLFSAPQGEDTTLSSLTLTFPGYDVDGTSYIGGTDYDVANQVDKVKVTAAANASEDAIVTATYQANNDAPATPYNLGDDANLAVGQNIFKITVTNGGDAQVHTLVVKRNELESSNINTQVEAVINGVKTVGIDAPDVDWILAMNAAGLDPSEAQIQAYLESFLGSLKAGLSSGSMAKHAIALTSLGIDATQVPDPNSDEDEAINLVQKSVETYSPSESPVYGAPYLLSLIDLPSYKGSYLEEDTRKVLIDAIVAAEDSWNEWDYDGTGMVLPALAPYYNASESVNGIDTVTCNAVTTAITAALAKISNAQEPNGSLGAPNSSTVATVITGLNAIGINAHTDSEFIKFGRSLLTNLLSFRTTDDKLGYTDRCKADDYSSKQGFQALATWQNLSNNRSSNLYHFSKEVAPYTNWPGARLLTGLAVTKQPSKLKYELGESDVTPNTDGIEITATYNADASNTEIVSIDQCEVSVIDCTTAGTKKVTITYHGKTAHYYVTVTGEGGTTPKQSTASVTVKHNRNVIARNDNATIESGVTTALDVLKSVLDANRIPYVESGGYVKEIDGLSEFSTGAESGWMYSVNGTTPPTTSAADYTLKDDDVVLWYFTTDYKKDPSSKDWTSQEPEVLDPKVEIVDGTATATLTEADLRTAIQNNTGTTVTIEPTGTQDAKAIEVNIPTTSAQAIASDTALNLSIKTAVGTVTIPNDTLASIASQAGTSITVRVEAVETADLSEQQQQAVGQDPVYDISIFSGSTQISNFGGKQITISLPYELKKDEQASGVAVWYLNDAGELERMRCTYSTATGLATFATTHLSKYIVGYTDTWYNPFEDVDAADWFYDAVDFAVSHQLFDGISETAFAPDRSMTRAMLATVLHRLEGTPTPKGSAGFDDVELGRWYSEAVAWATEQGITKGYGSRIFGTDDSVTREQMAEILYRYASYKNTDTSARANLSAYSDNEAISPWAERGVSWAVATGLIQGVSASKLAPSALSTRAQVATVLMRWIGEE